MAMVMSGRFAEWLSSWLTLAASQSFCGLWTKSFDLLNKARPVRWYQSTFSRCHLNLSSDLESSPFEIDLSSSNAASP